MNDSDKDKLNDVLSAIDHVEFKWDKDNMSVGVIAQEIGTIDLSDYTISGNTISSTWPSGSTIAFDNTLSAGSTKYGATTISTTKNTIDIDELADMMETLKKRLLILTPNFEQHEKYPMLKELYDEYKAMERLLSGPDTNE